MNNTNPALEATAAFQRWCAAFNARDVDTMIANMHFPHMRLAADNRFQRWETPDDFRDVQPRMTERLTLEGWDQTSNDLLHVVHAGPDKVHLALRLSRMRADGTAYNVFETLWIFTKVEGRWGAQFRSSFLANAVQGLGAR